MAATMSARPSLAGTAGTAETRSSLSASTYTSSSRAVSTAAGAGGSEETASSADLPRRGLSAGASVLQSAFARSVVNYRGWSYGGKASMVQLRWNLLWQVFALCGFFPFLAFFDSKAADVHQAVIILGIVQALFFTVGAANCWVYMWRVGHSSKLDWSQRARDEFGDSAFSEVRHIFVLPAYKEPARVLESTIETITAQTMAKSIVMVVSLEQKSPERSKVQEQLEARFGHSFAELLVTVHPSGLRGEMPGACSNRNWGVRRGLYTLERRRGAEKLSDSTIITVCDSDTGFHMRYAESLTYRFLARPDRLDVCYQSPLFYNMGLDQSCVLTRVTAIMRSFLMVGFLIPMSINTMSVYSVPVSLLEHANFFHPGYQMDDIIFTLSAMQSIGKRIVIELIDVPTLSGPTSGATVVEEVAEWRKQAKRWTIGSAEVFHYFMVKWIGGRFSALAGWSYGFWLTYYYGYVLCTLGIVSFSYTAASTAIQIARPELGVAIALQGTIWDFGLPLPWLVQLPSVYWYLVFFGTAFAMDRQLVRLLALKERVGCLRQLAHFVLAPLVDLAYNVVEFLAIAELTVYGKAVCGHVPSSKAALAFASEGADEELGTAPAHQQQPSTNEAVAGDAERGAL